MSILLAWSWKLKHVALATHKLRKASTAALRLHDGKRACGAGVIDTVPPKPLNSLLNKPWCAIAAIVAKMQFDVFAKQQTIFWYRAPSFYCLCH
jgi:hypothetical protein